MKYYQRTITKREAINRFGKLGFVPYVEFFKTNNEKFLEEIQKGKRIKFDEVNKDLKFNKTEINKVYSIKK